MLYRPLGSTGIDVSAIGFGAWGIGGHVEGGLSYGHTDDSESLAAVEAALDSGVTFFDTAPLYGEGRSETLLGRALTGRRDRAIIATKAGYSGFGAACDITPRNVRASLEGSLRRLGTDWVDVLQLHDPLPDEMGAEIVAVLEDLRSEGKIRTFGVSARSPVEALALAERFPIPVFQVNFSMLDLRAVDCGLMGVAGRRGIGVIARTPLFFGFLGGGMNGDEELPPQDHRSRWPVSRRRQWAEGGRQLLRMAGAEADGDGDTVLALRFLLSFPAVATTIPGMLTPEQVAENVPAGSRPPYSPALLDSLIAAGRILDEQVKPTGGDRS